MLFISFGEQRRGYTDYCPVFFLAALVNLVSGFSYIQIADNQMEHFAPVVACLAGK
jgi:hypothetical protein